MSSTLKPMIMATIADNRCTAEFVRRLMAAGMSAVRINSAHVNAETFNAMVATIRSVSPDIKILMDTKGPEIRTTATETPIEFFEGDTTVLVGSAEPTCKNRICINATDMGQYVEPGMYALVDDGAIEFEIIAIGQSGEIEMKAIRGGVLESRKTVNVPGVDVKSLPAVSKRDAENITMAVRAGIDMIAHSFVRSASDVEAVRDLISGSGIQLYSKVECRSAVKNLDEIMAASDGILVARGDLGTQFAIESIPSLQHMILKRCRQMKKPVIVSTQILQSMTTKPYPTRAEVNDVACAVMQGASTLLLCGETAQGDYPAECVDVMARTINATTRYMDDGRID